MKKLLLFAALATTFLILSPSQANAGVRVGVNVGLPVYPVAYPFVLMVFAPAPVVFAPTPVFVGPRPVFVGNPRFFRPGNRVVIRNNRGFRNFR